MGDNIMKFLLKVGYLFLAVFILINSISTTTWEKKVENPKYEYENGEDYYFEYEETSYHLWNHFWVYEETPKVMVETPNGNICINNMDYRESDSVLSNATNIYLSTEKYKEFHFEGIFIIILYVLFLIIIPIICFIKGWKNAKIRKKNAINAHIDEFYDKCISLKITSIETAKEKEKLLVVAKSFGYQTMDEATKNYLIGKERDIAYKEYKKQVEIAKKEKKNLQLQQEIEKKREEERQKYIFEKKISEITGKNKYISIIKDKIKSLQAEYKEIEKIDAFTPFMKHKKDNWGWIGGIADGIAGPGAGVMAAAEAHERNVNYNNAVDKFNTSLIQNGYDPTKVEEAKRKKLKSIENKIKRMKEYVNTIDKALINDDSINSDFDKLNFTVNGSVLEDTLNLSLEVSIKVLEPITLLEQDAIVDGSVLIKVLDKNNQKVGEAYYNACDTRTYELQKAGFNNSKKRSVVAIPCGEKYFDKKEKYHYEVAPVSIWTIEVC